MYLLINVRADNNIYLFLGKKYDDILKCNDFLFLLLYDSRNVVTGLGMIIMTVLSISEHRTSTAHELCSHSVTNN